MNHRPRNVAVSVIALISFTACRGHSADAGGDVALAHDLAEVQLAASSSGAGGRVASDSDDRPVSTDAADPPATKPASDPAPVAAVRNVSSHRPARAARKAAKQPASDPCASPDSRDQNSCLAASVAHSDARLDSIYRLIVKAVRKQQRIPAKASDPPYANELGKAEETWISWRDAECERVTHGKGGSLWAVARAKCLATLTDSRAAELDGILAKARRR